MDSNNNVVAFPVIKRRTPATSMEDVHERVAEARNEEAVLIVGELVNYLMPKIMAEGYDVGDPKCMRDYYLVCEALHGLLARSVDMYHPIHELTDGGNFDVWDEEEESE